jgi:sugar lactone lactonase YvrE
MPKMTMLLIALELLLAITCLSVAITIGYRHPHVQNLLPLRSERWVIRAPLAFIALLAASADVAAIAVPFLAFFAACLSMLVALGLLLALSRRSAVRFVYVSIMAALASLGVAMLQPLGLKVMLLPKADSLPYEPVQARVLKTYDEGVWFESVRAGADGTLYLAANIGLDFARSDYYRHAHGEVIEHHLDGTERVLFTTPVGSAAGVFAVAADGTIYMSSNGVTPGVWRIKPNGTGEMMTKLPHGAWPNGLDFGPDGMLYSPDSALGLIWRINPQTGEASKALEDKLLRARPYISLAPGANGLHFSGQKMIVTVSDSTKALQYTLQPGGSFGRGVELASGIPGDDFAIGRDGSLFITTHPYNTLVRVYPDGRRVVIGDARQHIVGATDAVFGRGVQDRDVLYVATDGGAFTGGPKTRGQLIALTPYAPVDQR